jgi:hypothetical protein
VITLGNNQLTAMSQKRTRFFRLEHRQVPTFSASFCCAPYDTTPSSLVSIIAPATPHRHSARLKSPSLTHHNHNHNQNLRPEDLVLVLPGPASEYSCAYCCIVM